MRVLRPLPLPSGPAVLDRLDDLRALLAGEASFAPVPDDPREQELLTGAFGIGTGIDDDVVLVIATSGSTGTPKGSQHTAATLTASAQATATHLGGAGAWLLALPPHHIAGLQVLLRSLAAGFTPAVLDLAAGFHPDAFADALEALDGPRRYTSLVPTQLRKALDSPRAVAALTGVDALLVGGAATPPALLHKAIDAGIPIVRTYGMSETAGGCVYDGIPLDGVQIEIVDAGPDGVGRVSLSGPMVAQGYRLLPDHPAFAHAGGFRTDDLGRVVDGVLQITGRADEAISTGGLTVVPQVVEAVIADDPAVAECAVVGVADERLGEKVVAVVVPEPGMTVDAHRIQDAVTDRLGRYAAPREVVTVAALPLRGPGKIDRRALRASLWPPASSPATGIG
ncbi:o-succinylbenzoate--CoA ligase [Gordonia desulfuricans]|uniref:o-succinylbenzoate--CoA ligase n=1 Tax=Gordonia desulfuricans TaxID=89051 RepID=UPI001EE4677C|nr:o-succinylbenzoate--CoA ligase [Gordonia desulfuricans]